MTDIQRLLCTMTLVALTCSPCLAWQSGSRSAISSAPSIGTPALGSPSIGVLQPSFAAPQPTFSGTVQNFSAPAFQPGQPTFQTPTMQAGPASMSGPTQTGPAGIPQSSLVDPIFGVSNPASVQSVDHSTWDHLLSSYIVTDAIGLNRFRYRQVSPQDHNSLKGYLQYLQSVDTRNLNRSEQLAFWFNLYNARTVDLVLDNYPIRSIRQIKTKLTDFVGPFDDPGAVTVLGKQLSLNDIESGIVRPVFNDPRIHYALNCASYGCPNLSPAAWRAQGIDARLNDAARQYINSDRALKRGLFGVRTAKIFKWYKDDFGGSDQAVLNHMRQYANGNTLRKLNGQRKIIGNFYDWSLNDGRILRRRILEPLIR